MESPLTPAAEHVAKTRYYQRDEQGNVIEDWRGLTQRVVDYVCEKETDEYKQQIFDLIYSTKFLPNSPCLVNAGRKGTARGMCACYVSKAPEDSWEGMVENIANFGHIARQGGGAGISLSDIRPEGDPVFGSTHAKACGPIEHMRMVSEVMSSITQSGFRGMAILMALDVTHPDVMKFIVCKQRDRALKTMLKEDIFNHYEQFRNKTSHDLNVVLDKFIYNCNISVVVSDEFMKAVEEDKDWNLTFGGKIYQTLKAKDIFNAIVHNAWKNGDPGLLFGDAMNNGPYKYSGQKINATNPCVSGDTLVATEKGWREVEEIEEGDLVFTRGNLFPVKTKEINNDCELYRVEFTDGGTIDVTASHMFKCVVGKQYKYIRLDELLPGTSVRVEGFEWSKTNHKNHNVSDTALSELKHTDVANISQRDMGLLLGSAIGDGSFLETHKPFRMCFGSHEKEWKSFYQAVLDKYRMTHFPEKEDRGSVRISSSDMAIFLEGINLKRAKSTYKYIPEEIMRYGNEDLLKGIVDGLFSTDGSMYLKKDNPILRFSNTSLKLCEQLRLILLGFGVQSRIYMSSKKGSHHVYADPKYGDRKITRNANKYDLFIMNQGIVTFHERINLSHEAKQQKIEQCVEQYHISGGSWKATIKNIEKLPGTHKVYDLFVEETDEWNTNGYISRGCGEQPIPEKAVCVLGSIDISKFYKEGVGIDWKSLREAVRVAVLFLDNVNEANSFPTPAFKQWSVDNRPIGLGIMGFADLLLKKKIAYGSPESIALAEKLMKFLESESHIRSVELAKERGTPKACQFKELEYRRNVTLTSIAPTGTIALLAGCSHAIEPMFSETVYRYDNTGQKELGEHPLCNEPYFRCAVATKDISKQVKWQEHIDIQAAFQKHCSSGISKTINLPSTATEEDIAEAYMRAWKSGNKGITIYRDRSKTTQVLMTESKSDNDRPKEVPCQIYRTRAEGIDWHAIVGIVNNRPYEIFAINGKVDLPPEGVVIKKKRRHYTLVDNEGNVLVENLNEAEQDIHPKVSLETRRFSLELRNGIDPAEIVEQIDKSCETIASFSKAISRIFKKHNFVNLSASELCPDCKKIGKEVVLIPAVGCYECPECHYSACG